MPEGNTSLGAWSTVSNPEELKPIVVPSGAVIEEGQLIEAITSIVENEVKNFVSEKGYACVNRWLSWKCVCAVVPLTYRTLTYLARSAMCACALYA